MGKLCSEKHNFFGYNVEDSIFPLELASACTVHYHISIGDVEKICQNSVVCINASKTYVSEHNAVLQEGTVVFY